MAREGRARVLEDPTYVLDDVPGDPDGVGLDDAGRTRCGASATSRRIDLDLQPITCQAPRVLETSLPVPNCSTVPKRLGDGDAPDLFEVTA